MAMPQPQSDTTLAPLQIRRNGEIYAADGGWFRARWHFSFDDYDDPGNVGIGALRVFNHDTLVPGAVWPLHPHRDIEGLTYVVAGEFEHADNLGNDGVLHAGGAQRMTLGSGAWHSERNHSQTEPMEFIQMWIEPNRPGLPPSVEQYQFTGEDRYNTLLPIFKSVDREGPGISVNQDICVCVALLEPRMRICHEVPAGHVGYFYLISGALEVNDTPFTTGDAAKIAGGGWLHFASSDFSELMVVNSIVWD